MTVSPEERPYAWADVDLGAVAANARLLSERAAPAALCAVVKGWGYGHGMVRSAAAAVEGGASWLGVALASEAIELRRHLPQPILIMAEPPLRQLVDIARLEGVRPTLYTAEAVTAAARAAREVGRVERMPVHLKIDTGMHRVGAAPEAARHLAELIRSKEELALEGICTHLAASENPELDGFTAEQLARFEAVRAELADAGITPPLVHVSNSGAVLAHPEARYDMVRCGIAIYGIAPRSRMPEGDGLRPAMSLKARVAFVKRLRAGEAVSYGLHHVCEAPTVIATVPIGYFDGVPRGLGLAGGEVLIGGRRRRIVGAVTMDQLMVDCGDDETVRRRDEVVLLGTQAEEEIGAWEWAERLGTIAYEVVCRISTQRVPRRYSR